MMDTSSRHAFQVHLPGLLTVLAGHLYTNQTVAIRELLQNAHDSCLRQRVEQRDDTYRPRIELRMDAARGTLTIGDNGAGLTADDIHRYLTTIGSSYTREIKGQMDLLSRPEASELIGQFGFGFLSAFMIASDICLTTRSSRNGSPALRWSSNGDGHYELVPIDHARSGTTIELTLKPNAAYLLDPLMLAETVRKYADFLPTPIYLDGVTDPVNAMRPPWEEPEPGPAIRQYIERSAELDAPLCVIELHDDTIDLGHDRLAVPLKGFLFIPAASIASLREYGDLTVFIRRMFITDRERDLLPAWARFVRGVIDSPLLQPTASREGVHQDHNYRLVQRAIGDQLSAALLAIAEHEPETWREIVVGHADLITGWAVTDDDFYDRVADLIPFQTTRGFLRLPEYLSMTGGTLYYVTRELGSPQEQLLAEGLDLPVINAHWFAVRPFLQKYADRHLPVELIQLDRQMESLLQPVADEHYERLLRHYAQLGIRVRMVSFQPADVPALLIHPQDARFLVEAQDAITAGELPSPFRDLIDNYLGERLEDRGREDSILYLNSASPIVQRLAATTGTEPNAGLVSHLLYQIARLFSARMLDARDAADAYSQISRTMEELLQ